MIKGLTIVILSLTIAFLVAWGFYLDSWWSSEFDTFKTEQHQLGYNEGYWKGYYDLCSLNTWNPDLCLLYARRGYRNGVHTRKGISGFDWSFVRLGETY